MPILSSGTYDGNGYEFDVGVEFGTPSPRVSVLLDTPLTLTTDEGGKSYMVSGALGLVLRPTTYWNIVPLFRAGGAGSFEVGALAILCQASLASMLTFDVYGYDLLIGNMFSGGSNVDGITFNEYEIDYDIDTFAFSNGFELGRLLGVDIAKFSQSARVFFTATNFINGDSRYTPHHYETGVLLTSQVRDSSLDQLKLRLGYLGGEGYDSFKLSLSAHW